MRDISYQVIYQFQNTHWWCSGRRTIVRRLLGRHLAARGSLDVLDVGCGPGANLGMLREYGRVTALDPYPEAVAFARTVPGAEEVRFRTEGITGSTLAGDSFDLVTALDVIEHIDDDAAALREIRRVLRPGAAALFTVPAFMFLWGHTDELNEHKRRYTAGELRRKLEDNGFRVLTVTYFNFFLFPAIFAARRIMRLLGVTSHEITMTTPALNRIFAALLGIEARLVTLTSLPFGVSIAAVCRKAPDCPGAGNSGGAL